MEQIKNDSILNKGIEEISTQNLKIFEGEFLPTIAYMINPDKVFYNSMDFEIINKLKEQGANVIQVNLEDISFNMDNGQDSSKTIFVKDKPIKIDGFISYGYMSKFHFQAFELIIFTLNEMGIPLLHTPEVVKILNNKYLQSVKFRKAGIPIPSTQIGFSVESFKFLMNGFYQDFSVHKRLSDYGGDGIIIQRNNLNAINSAAKLLWEGEYSLFQNMIKDSIGKSIRVLCIGGKPAACAEYHDKTGSYKSNCHFGFEFYSLNDMMDNPKLLEYYDLGLKAINSIGENITIGGVDILDSKEMGLVVLEVNLWPDIYDISSSTKIDLFSLFAKTFYDKVMTSLKDEKTKNWDSKVSKN